MNELIKSIMKVLYWIVILALELSIYFGVVALVALIIYMCIQYFVFGKIL